MVPTPYGGTRGTFFRQRTGNLKLIMVRKTKWALLVTAAIAILGTSCVPRRAIYVSLTDQVELAPSSGGYVLVRAGVRVENHNPQSVRLREGVFNSWHDGRELGTITLQSPIEVSGHSTDTVWVPLEVRFKSAGRMVSFALRGGVDGWQDVEVEGYVRVRYGATSKRLRVPREKIGKLILQRKG